MADVNATRRQRAEMELQQRFQAMFVTHVHNFPINVEFPAKVEASTNTNGDKNTTKVPRTNADLVQFRLLEAGVLFDDSQTLGEVNEALANFISNMTHTGCYHSVQVKIGGEGGAAADQPPASEPTNDAPPTGAETLHVILNEKNWYRLYMGGGLKHEGLQTSGDSLLPKVQFETSANLLNLTGHLDATALQYTMDHTSSSTLSFQHERPLYTLLPENSLAYGSLLALKKGSQISFACRAVLDTLDYEWTRSYKEYQRLLSLRVSNLSNVSHPEMAQGAYSRLDWSLLFRDIIPRRHASLPYAADASPEIVAQAGPSVKHSLSYEYRSNGSMCNDRFQPTSGIDIHGKVEVAGPPGDVGMVKAEGAISGNCLLPLASIAIHGSLQSGILQSLSFGGLCGLPSISDRFFVGGPMQLRGFVPSGIGPRAKTGGLSTPGGDSLGGDFFYTATLAASAPFPLISYLKDTGVRLFGFANVGTLVGLGGAPFTSVLRSSRASLGGGISLGTTFGRVEATYAVPMRYSPRDARKSVQIGLGFTFG